MKMNTIISRYIFKEMIAPFALNIFFFTFIFLLTRILDITNMIVHYNVGMGTIGRMLLYSMPYFLVFVIPMSVMMAVLLTFLRMSADNEIIALRAGGMSLFESLPPVFMFCLFSCLLTAFMIIQGLPWGRMSLKNLTVDAASAGIDMGIKERTFNNGFKDVMLYVNQVDLETRTLIDVFIEDRRNKNAVITVTAPKGRLYADADRPVYHLQLLNGAINQVNLDSQTVNDVRFEQYDLRLDMEKALESRSRIKDEKEMYLGELVTFINNYKRKDSRYYTALIEFHRKFSIPFACFALGFLAVPLGVQSRLTRRSFGLGLGIVFFLFYYLLLSVGAVFGESGSVHPAIGMWMPNVVIGGMGLYLILRGMSGRPIPFERIPAFFRRLIFSDRVALFLSRVMHFRRDQRP